MNKKKYVQYGCGFSAPSGWGNFDASPTLRFERLPFIGKLYTKNQSRFPVNVEYGDIVGGLPIAPGQCDGVYCSHILEHLSLNCFRDALHNTHKIMSPGATFRLVLPDLEFLCSSYLNNPQHESALLFMRETYLGHEKRERGIKALAASLLGNSQHLWMWDFKSINIELSNVGFVDIRRASFNDSSDPMFIDVEDKSRWDDCLGVECKKPL